ncbi:MAG: response regulator [Candidatus Omnitrophota bacterium]
MAKMKILLVDNEQDFLELTGSRIRSWGYEVITASSGDEALDVIKEKKADAVVLDYMMPGMDGLATLKEIRKIDDKIPVIMITAHPDMKSIKGAEGLGVSSYVPKISAYTDSQEAIKTALVMIARKRDGGKDANE